MNSSKTNDIQQNGLKVHEIFEYLMCGMFCISQLYDGNHKMSQKICWDFIMYLLFLKIKNYYCY